MWIGRKGSQESLVCGLFAADNIVKNAQHINLFTDSPLQINQCLFCHLSQFTDHQDTVT